MRFKSLAILAIAMFLSFIGVQAQASASVDAGGPPGFDYHSHYTDPYSCSAKGDDGERRGLWRDYVCVSNSGTSYDLWVLWNALA